MLYTYIWEFMNEALTGHHFHFENGLYLRFSAFNGVMITVVWQYWCTLLIILCRWRYTVLKATSVDFQINCPLSYCWVTPVWSQLNPERIIAWWHLAKWHTNYSHFHFGQKCLSSVMCEALIPFKARTNDPTTFSLAKSLLWIGWACSNQWHSEA